MKRKWPKTIRELRDLQDKYLKKHKVGWVMRRIQREADYFYTYEIRNRLSEEGCDYIPKVYQSKWLNHMRDKIINDTRVHLLLKVNLLLNIELMRKQNA